MSKIEVNTIEPQCGTTLTLGGSGDTVTLASGASQSGFGRNGAVDWQTTVKTSGFTATANEGYFVDTSSAAISVNLPAGTAGAIVGIADYAENFDTNKVTLVQNGSDKIGGSAVNATLTTKGLAVSLVFVDSTKGWIVTDSGLASEAPTTKFVTATGGTITTVCTNFKVHTFTGPGTFAVSCAGNASGSNTVDYLVVGGGSAGGFDRGGGGAAGGYRESGGTASGCYTVSPLGSSPSSVAALPVSVQSYSIAVGGGGAVSNSGCTSLSPGVASTFSTITSAGGGAAGNPGSPNADGTPGGSGGGARDGNHTGGNGNVPPVSPPQGNPGGSNSSNHSGPGGGGGGATGSGENGAGNPNPSNFGDGGAGATSSINGTPTARAGGGGSGGGGSFPAGGSGGTGGGGNGANNSPGTPNASVAGTANTGSGGGAGNGNSTTGNNTGSAGGSGVVIIRYKFQ